MAITKCKETRKLEITTSEDAITARREYRLWYGDSLNQADLYVATNLLTPFAAHDGTLLEIASIDVRSDPKHEQVYTAALDFSSAPAVERSGVGDETVSFDLSSQTVKTLVSPQTVQKYAISGSTAPDFKGGIGFDGKKFEGADVFVEQFTFSVTKILANSSITNAYIQSLRDTAFRWNSVVYRGQAIGECLFVGASGSPRDAKTYSVTYKFLASKHKTGLAFGDVSGITKQGWDYLWALFADVEDTTAKFVTPRPLAVYIERLYTSANFQAALGLQSGS